MLLGLAAYVGATFAIAWRYAAIPAEESAARAEVRGAFLHRRGERFLVKGVGYDPARPGELPWARERSLELLDADFAAIRAAGFNTIRTWETLSRDELGAAERHGLAVIQGVWVDPEGDFADPAFRRAAVLRAAEAARAARGHPAILAWLVMNEPRPPAVLASGIDTTRLLLRELAEAVRAEDPGVPVGFASWPGLEMLDEPSLDFVAANLYPFRPSALLSVTGYDGMVRLWKQEQARERPLLVTEFGVSVSPGVPAPDAPGGATEAEQRDALPRHADGVVRAGAGGGAVFMWIDGWWKNADAPGDEQSHDPDDGEEWFGLQAMDALGDDAGRARPALEAMRAFNRAVLTMPADGPVAAREIEVEAHVEEAAHVRLHASLNGGEPAVVPSVREGPWVRGRMGLLAEATGPQRLDLAIVADGAEIARFERWLLPPGEGVSLELAADGGTLIVRVRDGDGQPAPGVTVRLAVTEASRRFDRTTELRTNDLGEATLALDRPPSPLVLLVAGAVGEPPLALDWVLVEGA